MRAGNRKLCTRKFAISGEQVYGLVCSSAAPAPHCFPAATPKQRQNKPSEKAGQRNEDYKVARGGKKEENKGRRQEAFVRYNNREVMKESNQEDNNHGQKSVKMIPLNFF